MEMPANFVSSQTLPWKPVPLILCHWLKSKVGHMAMPYSTTGKQLGKGEVWKGTESASSEYLPTCAYICPALFSKATLIELPQQCGDQDEISLYEKGHKLPFMLDLQILTSK